MFPAGCVLGKNMLIDVRCAYLYDIVGTHSPRSERSFSAGTLPIDCPLPANMYDSPVLANDRR